MADKTQGKRSRKDYESKRDGAAMQESRKFAKQGDPFSARQWAAIVAMSRTCARSMRAYRSEDWTPYARRTHSLAQRNFGNGLEPASKCFGCQRWLPCVLITGDHIVPQSDRPRLREALAFQTDRFDRRLYQRVIRLSLGKLRSHPEVDHVRTIKRYDETLPDDLRNIQPLCWYCNTVKGNRQNVTLYPQDARVARRPNEAPF